MLAGNHQQMHRAGVLQHLPIGARQPGAIAQHQRRQAALSALRIDRQQALTNKVAPRPARRCQQLTIHHRTGGTDALRQQPGFVIKSIRIDQPGRPLEFDRHAPALTAVDLRTAVPRHPDACRQYRPARPCPLQFETHHALGDTGQTDYLALQPQRLTVQTMNQTVIQRPLRRNTRPGKTEQEQRQWIGTKR